MKMPLPTFKLCLAVAALAVGLCACAEFGKPKGPLAILRLHVQVSPDGSDRSSPVQILRDKPMQINVEHAPFLTEQSLTNAVLVESLDTYAIKLQFDSTGAMILEQYSVAYRSRHCAIFCQWGDKTQTNRWLGAPIFTRPISDGTLVFTPDASRDESAEIVTALKNAIKYCQKMDSW